MIVIIRVIFWATLAQLVGQLSILHFPELLVQFLVPPKDKMLN